MHSNIVYGSQRGSGKTFKTQHCLGGLMRKWLMIGQYYTERTKQVTNERTQAQKKKSNMPGSEEDVTDES